MEVEDAEVVVDPQTETSENTEAVTENEITKKESGCDWRIRVCPILFEDFCRLRKEFVALLKLCSVFEYRMSMHLFTRLDSSTGASTMGDRDIPWLPNEKIYTKPQNAATAGMMELKVHDTDLVDAMVIIRTADLSKKNRLRFELKREKRTKKEEEEAKAEGGEGKTEEGEAKTEEGEAKMEVEGEEEKKEEGEEAAAVPGADDATLPTEDMTVNFAVRLRPVKDPAFSHPKGQSLSAEDKQIFLKKVPEDLPDYVLKAIMLSEMRGREKSDDGISCATFNIVSKLGAQGYMELFDGVLVNQDDIEMSTTLGTLYDARKKHSEKELKNREANEQQMIQQGLKRKPSGEGTGPKSKKPRAAEGEVDHLNPISVLWVRGRGRGTAQLPTRGGQPTRGGPPARGRREGGPSRGRGASGRGFPPTRGRGGLGAPPGRGGTMRGRGGSLGRGGRSPRGAPGLMGPAPLWEGGALPRRDRVSPRMSHGREEWLRNDDVMVDYLRERRGPRHLGHFPLSPTFRDYYDAGCDDRISENFTSLHSRKW